MPEVEKEAVVTKAEAFAKLTLPGPLTFEVPYLSPWPRPVRDGVFGFIETAMRYAAGADETDASHRQQVARDVSRRARMDPENSPLAVH